MQAVSAAWTAIMAADHWKETRLLAYTTTGADLYHTYSKEEIEKAESNGGIFGESSPKVGEAVAGELDLVLLTTYTALPKMARIIPQVRLCNASQQSEWLRKGVYYIDTRDKDRRTGELSLHAYDAMLTAEDLYVNGSAWSSKTAQTVVREIAARMGPKNASGTPTGISINSDTLDLLDSLPAYAVNYDETLTMRQYLKNIGAAWGGSWIIDENGELRLVRMAAAGASRQNLALGAEEYSDDDPQPAVQCVKVKVDDTTTYTAGSGFAFTVSCPFGTQAMADNLLSLFRGWQYHPYTAENCPDANPALEIGDAITINGTLSVIGKRTLAFGGMLLSDFSAPADQEVNHEYPYGSSAKKTTQRQIASTNSAVGSTRSATGSMLSHTAKKYWTAYMPADAVTGDYWIVTSKEDVTVGGVTYKAGSIYVKTADGWEESTTSNFSDTYVAIRRNANSIESIVAKTGVNSLGQNETLYSRITQTADAITAEVSKTGTGNLGEGETLYSKINQTATSIRAEVSENYQVKGNYYTVQSSITIESNCITLASGGSIVANSDGAIIINGSNFKLNSSGRMEANGAIFTGNVWFNNNIGINSAGYLSVGGEGQIVCTELVASDQIWLAGVKIESWDDIVPKFGA